MNEDLFEFEGLLNDLFEPRYNDICDWTRKEIGDRVSIIDYCSVSNLNINKLIADGELDAVPYFIIINNNIKHNITNNNITYIQDVIIANPQNKKCYRIASQHIKHKC